VKTRLLHPSFFTDVKVAALSPNAKVLLLGLWLRCDDHGRALYLPKLIAGEVFPLEQVDIQSLLNEVLTGGFIHTYEVANWDRHQKPKYKKNSVIPSPPEPLEQIGPNYSNDGEGLGEINPKRSPVFVSESESELELESEASSRPSSTKSGRTWPWRSDEAKEA
jgi:hypothetical protein